MTHKDEVKAGSQRHVTQPTYWDYKYIRIPCKTSVLSYRFCGSHSMLINWVGSVGFPACLKMLINVQEMTNRHQIR